MPTNVTETAPAWILYGDGEPDIVAAGHSHAACLIQAIHAGFSPAGRRVAVAYAVDPSTGPPSGPAYWAYAIEAARGGTLVIVWNGNQHQAAFLVAPDPPIWVADGDNAGYGMRVPREMLRAHWSQTFDELSDVLRLVPEGTNVVVLGTPPPKREGAIRAHLAQEGIFQDYARQRNLSIAELPLTAERDRLAMWTILQDLLRQRALDGGARFLPIPAESTDDEGFLLPEYSAIDATHANAAYGALAWSDVSELLTAELS